MRPFYNLPSIKSLESAFPGKGKTLRNLLESNKAVNEHPAVIELCNACYNPPTMAHKRMTALDSVAETFGVEYVQGKGTTRSPSFEYLNTGETYDSTIVRFRDGRYRVTSWGGGYRRKGQLRLV